MEPLISVIIPYAGEDVNRRWNLWFVTRWVYLLLLASYGQRFELIVVTQNSPNLPNFGSFVNVINVMRPLDTLSVGWLRNYGVIKSRGSSLLFLDADIVLHKEAFVLFERAMQKRGDSKAFLGFDNCTYLDEHYTERMIKLNEPLNSTNGRRMRFQPGGALFVSRSAFEAVGGYPTLEGYGFEDLILNYKLGFIIPRLSCDCVHLWHEPQRRDTKQYLKNHVEWLRVKALGGKDFPNYISSQRAEYAKIVSGSTM